MKTYLIAATALATTLALAQPAAAAEAAKAPAAAAQAAAAQTPAVQAQQAKTLDRAKDDSPVTISGTIAEVGDDDFQLNYGKGKIRIETEDEFTSMFDESNPQRFKAGDRVTVYGELDKDWFSKREIEASAIVRSEGKQIYSAYYTDDYEGIEPAAGGSATAAVPTARFNEFYFIPEGNDPLSDRITLTGRVTEISGDDFTINYGTGDIKVDTDKLDNDPLDKSAINPIQVGKYVAVYGEIDDHLFTGKEIKAYNIVQYENL